MDAVEYLKAITYMHGKGCHSCPAAKDKNGKGISCGEFQRRYPEKTVEIVEEYWKKNKPKTNAEWVKEKLEEIGYSVDIKYLKKHNCPPHQSNEFLPNISCKRGDASCIKCEKWWDEYHEEEE